ncbi:GIY-YIG nuclease family protein [Fodinibius sediminis]|nr:GIY-YIG nuclease family protein [Fodinibius sediminis]SMO76675.1 putative endonuclease [Fodinibius sediminis]
MFYTYIIYSKTRDQYYTGSTSVEVELRLKRHNEGWTRSTKAGIPWELKYYRSFSEKSEALKWEYAVKRQKSRAFIERLIASPENEIEG